MSRDLEKERQWRKRLQAWRDSGLTVAQFCDREGLNDHNFRSWQATIKQRDEEQFQKIMSKKQLDQPAAFVPVTLVKEPKHASHTCEFDNYFARFFDQYLARLTTASNFGKRTFAYASWSVYIQ
jgi:hypothetical protein